MPHRPTIIGLFRIRGRQRDEAQRVHSGTSPWDRSPAGLTWQVPGGELVSSPGYEPMILPGGDGGMVVLAYHWFFPRKARIALFTLLIYAALC